MFLNFTPAKKEGVSACSDSSALYKFLCLRNLVALSFIMSVSTPSGVVVPRKCCSFVKTVSRISTNLFSFAFLVFCSLISHLANPSIDGIISFCSNVKATVACSESLLSSIITLNSFTASCTSTV